MISLRRRTIEMTVACLIATIPMILLFWVYADQVPESFGDDISARVYPDALAYAWLILSALAIVEAWFRSGDEVVLLRRDSLVYPAAIFLIVAVGFALLMLVGYLVAAAFYIVTFSWLLKERGPAAWTAAIIVPPVVYVLLLYAFEVRLPSSLASFAG